MLRRMWISVSIGNGYPEWSDKDLLLITITVVFFIFQVLDLCWLPALCLWPGEWRCTEKNVLALTRRLEMKLLELPMFPSCCKSLSSSWLAQGKRSPAYQVGKKQLPEVFLYEMPFSNWNWKKITLVIGKQKKPTYFNWKWMLASVC